MGRAITYLLTGKDNEAEKDVDQAISVAPKSGSAYAVKGLVFLARGDETKAQELFEQAQTFDSNVSKALQQLKKTVQQQRGTRAAD